jgi:CHRD domain
VRRTTRVVLAGVIAVLLVAAGVTAAGATRGGDDEFDARLSGFEETPMTISTTGSGRFEADVDRRDQTIEYELSYSGIEGGTVTAAHIHLGRRATTGGVSAFLCGGGGKPPCPQSGTVEGTVTAADVIGPAGQGIAAGQFDELVRAMRAEATYVNVHTTPMWPGGEIRGTIREDD